MPTVDHSSGPPWLTLLGLEETSHPVLSVRARDALGQARHVFGAARYFPRISSLSTATLHPWPSPLSQGLQAVLLLRHQPGVVVLASGDPLHYGVGKWLLQQLARDELQIIPAVSSISHACAWMGWSQQDITVLSLHGRNEAQLYRYLEDQQRLLVLTSDDTSPIRLCQMLVQAGYGQSELTLLETLGSAQQRCRSMPVNVLAEQPLDEAIASLNIMALTLHAAAPASTSGWAAGRPNQQFSHDGQITRGEVRAVVMAYLHPRPEGVLWDLGAGSGAIAIEWLRTHSRLHALAVERHPERCQVIADNAHRFGVPQLEIINGELAEIAHLVADKVAPSAIFIGGGARWPLIDFCMARLRPYGRLVVNAVTLETEQLLCQLHQQHGGQLTRMSLEHATALGEGRGWTPARTITIWCWQRGT